MHSIFNVIGGCGTLLTVERADDNKFRVKYTASDVTWFVSLPSFPSVCTLAGFVLEYSASHFSLFQKFLIYITLYKSKSSPKFWRNSIYSLNLILFDLTIINHTKCTIFPCWSCFKTWYVWLRLIKTWWLMINDMKLRVMKFNCVIVSELDPEFDSYLQGPVTMSNSLAALPASPASGRFLT